MNLLSFILAALSCSYAIADDKQEPLLYRDRLDVKNIAIIGAGAAGASSAYHLAKFAASESIPVNITVFERESYIGGRSTTVNAYDDASFPVELGASIFVDVNRILVKAAKEFNLSANLLIRDANVPGDALAVWNGQELVYSQTGQGSWWDTAKLIWKYGLAPIKTARLVTAVVNRFLTMYEEPAFPFSSLTQTAQDVGLLAVTAATGTQYLEENGVSGRFADEILQASTRVNYAQNLNYIHGLEAMVCGAAEKPKSVHGGNWKIFDRMIQAANATAVLKRAVTSVERTKHDKYELRFEENSAMSEQQTPLQHFDAVVIAGPHQFSNISLSHVSAVPDAIPYVELHVTLFTSPHLLSPKFFNLEADKPAPRVVLTTLPKGETPLAGPEGVGSPGFFSISLLDPVTNPRSGEQEYLYKIFSAEPPNSTFFAHLLGLQEPHTAGKGEISKKDITWMFRKVWHSYPYEYPRVTFENIQLDKGLWYTGGMESFISTMETNALMGMNVARLMVDDWLGKDNSLRDTAEMKQPHLLAKDGL